MSQKNLVRNKKKDFLCIANNFKLTVTFVPLYIHSMKIT